MEEVEEIRRSRAEAFYLSFIKAANGGEQCVFRAAARASVEKTRKCELVIAALVDIRNAKVRLPEKRVFCPRKDTSLLGD